MDFNTLLTNRRSIREFQDREVPLSILKEIIQETSFAPTAGNRQPLKFIVIRDRELIRRISDDSKKSLLDDLLRDPSLPLKQYEAALRDGEFNVFYNAPCLVLFTGPKNARSIDVDCGLTAAYFMFSAASRGLGTCWIGLGGHVRDLKILDEIAVPADCQIVAPLIVGYPKSIPPASERRPPDILKII